MCPFPLPPPPPSRIDLDSERIRHDRLHRHRGETHRSIAKAQAVAVSCIRWPEEDTRLSRSLRGLRTRGQHSVCHAHVPIYLHRNNVRDRILAAFLSRCKNEGFGSPLCWTLFRLETRAQEDNVMAARRSEHFEYSCLRRA